MAACIQPRFLIISWFFASQKEDGLVKPRRHDIAFQSVPIAARRRADFQGYSPNGISDTVHPFPSQVSQLSCGVPSVLSGNPIPRHRAHCVRKISVKQCGQLFPFTPSRNPFVHCGQYMARWYLIGKTSQKGDLRSEFYRRSRRNEAQGVPYQPPRERRKREVISHCDQQTGITSVLKENDGPRNWTLCLEL